MHLLSKNFLFIFLLSAFSFTNSFAQLRFQDGYYINKDGVSVKTQIENKKWITWSNDYLQISDNGTNKKIPVNELQEFGIHNKLKFITANVMIEKSSDNLEKMEGNSIPEFVKEEVLLKVLIEGEYSLYVYVGDNVRKFFYRKGDGVITQLVRKRYKVEDDKIVVMEDNLYHKQLDDIQNCPQLETTILNYEAFSLKRFFLKLNKCVGSNVAFVRESTVESSLGLSVSAGVIYSNVNIDRSNLNFQMNNISPTAGLNLVYKIPLIYNEIGIKLSGTYNSIETETVEDFPNGFTDREITFSHSEFIVGASGEYIFYTGNNKAFYTGIGYYYPLLLEDSRYTETISNLDLNGKNSDPFPGLYVGYQLNKFDVKLQYFLRNNNVLKGFSRFEADIDQIYIGLGYSIF